MAAFDRGALARVGDPAASALPAMRLAAAKDMNDSDRGAMIRGMVDRLATRLKQNGDDVEGCCGWWGYMVMGERDKALSAQSRRGRRSPAMRNACASSMRA